MRSGNCELREMTPTKIRKKQNENYHPAKSLIFVTIYEFITTLY